MSQTSRIAFRYSGEDLHIQVRGNLDGSSAWELVNTIHERYKGKGRVLIDTCRLQRLFPFGIAVFKSQLDPTKLPLDRLVFTGEKGL